MRKFFILMSLLAASLTCAPALAATSTDFYRGLLERGVADVEAGRFGDAVTPLRLAAFGLVDTIEAYETSLAYLAVALDKTGQTARVADVLQRILAAERVERRFASLPLPVPIRTQVDALVRTQLSSAEAAALAAPSAPATGAPRQSPQPPSRSGSTPSTQPAPMKQAPKDPQPTVTRPQPQPSQSAVVAPKPAGKPPQAASVADVPSRLAGGERALTAGNLNEARRIYREFLAAPTLDHAVWIRVAEGLYRSRDFSGALAAFDKVKTLRAGEEAYRFYVAVALFETGQFARARQELAAALPYLELTPDVMRYRKKIEEAR